MVSTLDLQSKGHRFDFHFHVMTLGKLFHTHVHLSPSSIIWYRAKVGNGRSGIALAVHYRLSGIATYGLNSLEKRD